MLIEAIPYLLGFIMNFYGVFEYIYMNYMFFSMSHIFIIFQSCCVAQCGLMTPYGDMGLGEHQYR